MANNKNHLDNLTPFKKGFDERRDTTGKSRKLLSELTAEGYTKQEVVSTYTVLLSRTIKELNAVLKDENATALERIVAGSIHKDFTTKNLRNVESVLSRAYGKPTQAVDLNADDDYEVEELTEQETAILMQLNELNKPKATN